MNSLVTSHESVHHKTECGVAIHEVHGREPVKPFEEKQVLKLVQHKALEAFQQKKSDLLLAQPKKGKPSLYSIRLDHDAVLGLRNLVDSCDSASETGSQAGTGLSLPSVWCFKTAAVFYSQSIVRGGTPLLMKDEFRATHCDCVALTQTSSGHRKRRHPLLALTFRIIPLFSSSLIRSGTTLCEPHYH